MVTSRLRHLRIALVAAVLAALVIGPAAIAAPPGNNGTVKIHEGAGEPSPEIKNEPHVCTFDLHFYFADAGQVGAWWIDQQPPTGRDASGLDGTYLTDSSGQYATVEYGLPAGHYKLYWEGRNDQNIKHKTFWVTCDNPPGPIGGEEEQPE
jgi:hypothetical protein